MKLFWSGRSPYVRKVMVVAYELGLEHRIELVAVSVDPFHREAELAAANPLQRIPTLVTADGEALFGSNEICAYLDELAGGDPASVPHRAMRRKVAIGDGLADLGVMWTGMRFQHPAGVPDSFLMTSRAKLAGTCDLLDREVDLLGDGSDVGNAAIAVALAYFDFRFGDEGWRAGRARLAAWFARFAARPSMLATAYRG